MSQLRVHLGNNSYDVIFDQDIDLTNYLSDYQNKKICLVSDSNVYPLHGDKMLEKLMYLSSKVYSFIFPAGEVNKTLNQVMQLIDLCIENQWNRDDLIIVLGGGVAGDMGAFAASVILRGIDCIHVPTTLLAQVDSSIGGKTAVNHPLGKNLIGTFYQPKKVLISSEYLQTLSLREIQTGFAEVIKYGIIQSEVLFDFLIGWFDKNDIDNYKSFPLSFWQDVVWSCAQIKADVVSKDEKESSLRKILNYGHTFGHAIEKLTSFSRYTHGEAVAIGMNVSAYLAWRHGICKECVYIQQKKLIQKIGLPIEIDADIKTQSIISTMRLDKKVSDGKLTLILPECIGKVRIDNSIAELDIFNLLKEYRNE
ncbi:MAG: 3-dehydroquinate synthase [Candidatus Margulisbacteria bacterium GWF2_35_9]|nr:MAG: 3-dehydroquinate synthase [Candidatus Margulisbacteria bacterium GWF2_35_9]